MGKQTKSENSANGPEALGIIETRGMTGAIEALDAMTKSADVSIASRVKIDAGIVTVTVRGDVGSVGVAVATGAEAARRVGELRSSHVISRPHDNLEKFLA